LIFVILFSLFVIQLWGYMLICRNAEGGTWSEKGWEPLLFYRHLSSDSGIVKNLVEPKQKYKYNFLQKC